MYEHVLLYCIIMKLLYRYSRFLIITPDVTSLQEARRLLLYKRKSYIYLEIKK
jgi:hypothetical protein